MAGGGDDLVKKFQEFCTLAGSKDKTQMTSKANGKMVGDCLNKDYKKFEVTKICDASVFPAVKEKGKPFMTVNKANVEKFVNKTAHEIAKRKSGNNKIAEDDPVTVEIKANVISCISGGGPQVKQVAESKTGNVGGLTDASKYTGAHKERFDADGKGKGSDGRVDKADNSGYVGNYKGEGSYSKK